ncbi:MAG: phospho-N-acetylmuramoyl-pentapeptide-transferase [Firmicutes bacterium]|nr:phospho-N-acetylmuramoyl-pentapeptide-transferase [Bacillota bacterium]
MFILQWIIILIITLIAGQFITNKLKKYNLEQTIRDDGPQTHLKKQGTPSMGGLIFLIPIIIASFIYLPHSIIPLLALIGYGSIGIYDDLDKRVIKKSGGISIKKKLLLEIMIGLLVGILAVVYQKNTNIGFTEHLFINVNWIIYVLFIAFFIIAVTNGTNLTDGLDGLATLTTIPIFIFFVGISLLQGNNALAQFNALVIAALLGFLVFNKHPARIFMGDTGSLALGALVAGMSILLNVEFLLLIFGFIYLVESVSVLLQVAYFKNTYGKRLFKMAPIHHHFELSGWGESKVVILFTIIAFLTSALSYIIYTVL